MPVMELQRVNLSASGFKTTFEGKSAVIVKVLFLMLIAYAVYQVFNKPTLNVTLG